MSINTLSGTGLRDRNFNSFFQDNLPVTDANHTGSPAIGRVVGGVAVSGTPTYANYDGVPFTFTTDGRIRTDTELEVSGVEINNIKVYSTDNTSANSRYGLIDGSGVVFMNLDQVGSSSVDVNIGSVGDGTLRVTIGSDDPIVTSLGTLDNWNVNHDGPLSDSGLQIMGAAQTAQASGVNAGSGVRLVSNVYGEQVIAGYNWNTQSIRTEEIDPLPEKYVSETLANASSQPSGTTNYFFDMNGFKTFAVQIEDTAGAAGSNVYTVATSIQDDGTAPSSATYQDVTNAWFGAGNFTTDAMLVRDTPAPVKFVRVRVSRANGSSADGAWTIYLKKMY